MTEDKTLDLILLKPDPVIEGPDTTRSHGENER